VHGGRDDLHPLAHRPFRRREGIIDEADVDAGRISVIAPEGFMEEAVAENVFVGTAMGRRSDFMYGAALPKGPDGQIGCGLGQTTSTGEPTLIPRRSTSPSPARN